jgi:opacity protein-like surface antigen
LTDIFNNAILWELAHFVNGDGGRDSVPILLEAMAMKKNIYPILALGLTLALGLAAPAAAQDFSSFYVTPKLMTSYQKADMNGGHERSSVFGLGFAVGTDMSFSSSLPLRVEAEYIYHGNQTFDSPGARHDVTAHSLMANAFFDFQTDTVFTPYAGGGVGMGYIQDSVSAASVKVDSWNFAWNVGGGLAWNFSETLALDLGYRYMDLGKVDGPLDHNGRHNLSLTAHEFSVGLRFMSF